MFSSPCLIVFLNDVPDGFKQITLLITSFQRLDMKNKKAKHSVHGEQSTSLSAIDLQWKANQHIAA
jgi:hypothetical protein